MVHSVVRACDFKKHNDCNYWLDGNYNINVTVSLGEATLLRRLYIAVGLVPVYAIEHNFFHQLADAAQESNRTV